MTSYDCATFDKNNYCISFQARYSNFDSMNEGAGVLTMAYKPSGQVRVGAFIDYRAGEQAPTNIKFGSERPTFGAFVGFAEKADGTGLQGKVVAAVQTGAATITRSNKLENTEPGSGKGSLNSYVFSLELGRGYAVAKDTVVTPFVGIRHSASIRGSYSEVTIPDTVDYPISYNDYSQRLTTASVGARVAVLLSEKFGYQLSAGLESDLSHKNSTYSGSSTISDLETFALVVNGANNRTRGFGSAGLYYQVDKGQRFIANVNVRSQAFTSQTAVSVLAGYQMAF